MTTPCAATAASTTEVVAIPNSLFEAMFSVLKDEVLSAADNLASTQVHQPLCLSQHQCTTVLYKDTDLPLFFKQLLRMPSGGRHENFWHGRNHGGTHADTALKDKLRTVVEHLSPTGSVEGVYSRIEALYSFSVIHDLPCYMISGSMYAGLLEGGLRSKSFVFASSAEDVELIETLFTLSPPPNVSFIHLHTRGW